MFRVLTVSKGLLTSCEKGHGTRGGCCLPTRVCVPNRVYPLLSGPSSMVSLQSKLLTTRWLGLGFTKRVSGFGFRLSRVLDILGKVLRVK